MFSPPPITDEAGRLEVLRNYHVLDTPPEEAFDELVEMASRICDTPIALISLVDGNRQWFKARKGMEPRETPRELSFCICALNQTVPLIVPDTLLDERFANNPQVTSGPRIRFYAGVPLVTPDGVFLGTLCVADHHPRQLTGDQELSLVVLANQVMTHFELRRLNRERRASERKLRAIFEAEPECVKLLGSDATLHEINAAGLRLIEADNFKSVAGHCLLPLVAAEDRSAVLETLAAVAAGERRTVHFGLTGLKGTPHRVEMSAVPFHDETMPGNLILGVTRDITERRAAEERIQRLNRLYSFSSSVNGAIVRMQDTKEIYERACRIAVESGGLVMAWIGMLDPDGRVLAPVACWGKVEGYLDSIRVLATPDEPEGRGPAGRAFRSGAHAFCNDTATELDFLPFRKQALERGFLSCAAFPLKMDGCPVGVLTVYGDVAGYFDEEVLQLLGALAENISFASESRLKERRRLEMESALRESEARYRDIVEVSPDVIFINRNNRIEYINAAGLKLLRATDANQIIGRPPQEIFTPEFHRAIAERVATLSERPCTVPLLEEKMLALDGTIVDVEVAAASFEIGDEIMIQVVCHDLTERKRAETALRESNEKFHQFADNITDTFWIRSPDMREVRYVSPAFERIWGRPVSSLYANPSSWVDFIYPDDREQVVRAFGALVQESHNVDIEYRIVRPDGEIRWIRARGFQVRDTAGELISQTGIVTDVTERKLAEVALQASDERFRTFMEHSPAAGWIVDRQGYFRYSSPGYHRMFNVPSNLEGKHIREIYEPALAEPYLANNRLAIDESRVVESVEQGKRADGGPGEFLVVKFPIETPGSETLLGAIALDITERKKLEHQFLRAQRMESIGTLAGGIAHDLNNVLGPIIMSLDLLKMKFQDPSSRELLDIVGTSAQRGADMVRQVLSFARGVEGRKMEVQIRHLLKDIEKIANETFLKHIAVRTSIPANLWSIVGDPTQLHQVLLNLCVNARDAMPDGGTLHLSARNIDLDAHYAGMNSEAAPGPHILLQVEDNGTGMPSAIIDKIFEPFFTTKEVGKGTGLGLSTSLAIVKSHGGFIQVYSEPGMGTTFKVYLPARTEPAAHTAEDIAAEMPRGNGEMILVIDDEASVRQITRQTLEAFGYRVIVACDGAEGVAIYASRHPDIDAVLTDMMMPVMDGPTTIQVLRKINPGVRVIAASGLSANGHVAHAASIGVKHFLPKPYTAETLLKALSGILSAGS